MEAIAPLLAAAKLNGSDIDPPARMAVGVWSRPNATYPLGLGYTAPTKVYYSPEMSGELGEACGVPGLTEAEYREGVLQPFGPATPVYLANNDYAALDVKYLYGDWAEESLLQAERALRRLGAPKPDWLDAAYYAAKIAAMDRLPSAPRLVEAA